MPAPWFVGLDNDGYPLSGGLLYVFSAGTTTPAITYSDASMSTPNANPVVLDSAGRAVLFLAASSYKFVLKTSEGVTIRTQDDVGSVPATDIDLDIQGVAGGALTVNNVVYLSAGDGGRTAGLWYSARANNAYSSSTAGEVGFVPTSIASGATGAIRTKGRLTGFSGLTIGAKYYISTVDGQITTTPPAFARYVGTADSLTSLVIGPAPATSADAGMIVQVVHATYSTVASSSSSTHAATGLTATITPRSTANKVLVTVHQNGGRKYSSNTALELKILRGATVIGTPDTRGGANNASSENVIPTISGTVYDSPSAITATTYSTTFASTSNSAGVDVQYNGATSSMVLMEVVG
jgi:hypothetical protein